MLIVLKNNGKEQHPHGSTKGLRNILIVPREHWGTCSWFLKDIEIYALGSTRILFKYSWLCTRKYYVIYSHGFTRILPFDCTSMSCAVSKLFLLLYSSLLAYHWLQLYSSLLAYLWLLLYSSLLACALTFGYSFTAGLLAYLWL